MGTTNENGFGGFLRRKRQEKGLTQKELAKLLFVSESAVSKWEKDVSRPDIMLLPSLSEILEVTEHELITASVDEQALNDVRQARKWRALSVTWSLFFYIAYGITVLTCFICNLAVDHTLSWFWIVVSALLLSFTFTNLPAIVKKDRLILLPLSMFAALCLLLAVCCIYVGGDWFWVAAVSVFTGLIPVFVPIYIAKCPIFSKIKRYNDFISVAVSFAVINILLVVINLYTMPLGGWWYVRIALPIVLYIYLVLNLLLSIRFLKTNRFAKTGAILFLTDLFLYIPPLVLRVKDTLVQAELDDLNIFLADLSHWGIDSVDNNVHLIIALTLLVLAFAFGAIGVLRHFASTREKKN